MSAFTVNPSNQTVYIAPQAGALLKYLESNGRFPPVTLSVYRLEDIANLGEFGVPHQIETYLSKFISYSFKSSVLSPVEEFSCQIHYQTEIGKPKEGDIFALKANGIPTGSGIVDQVEIETDASMGTTLHVTGRNFLGQWEDQDAVSISTDPFYSNEATIDLVVKTLAKDTRIDPERFKKNLAPKRAYLFATQPGETKLSAMQRYCEALDIYFWMLGDGTLMVGRPNMYGIDKPDHRDGTLFMNSTERKSNVLTIRSVRASTQIPNIVVPLWNGQENVQSRKEVAQHAIYNNSPGPARLRRLGHRVPKAVVVSSPDGQAPQDLADINTLLVAQQNIDIKKDAKAASSILLQAYGKREMARANVKELNVQIQVAGHYNDNCIPFKPDQVYRVKYDVDEIDEDMYLYEVEYFLDEQGSQRSRLFFCKQSSIVADSRVFSAK